MPAPWSYRIVMVQVIEKNGIKRKLFYGMSSSTAMKKHKGGVAEYRQEDLLFHLAGM